MSRELQPPVPISLVKIELPTVIKNEPSESEIVEIGIDDILDSSESEDEIIPDIKEIDIVYNPVCEETIKSEILESKHCKSVETRVLVQAENSPFIQADNITQRNKTEDTSDENVTKDTGQGVVEIQASNEHSNVSISVRSKKSKSPKKTDFAECYKTDNTTLWEKEKEKIKVIKAPMIPVEAHEYTSLAKAKHICNHCQHAFNTLSNLKRHIGKIHREVTTMYQCPYCPYKSKWKHYMKRHFTQKHKDTKDIQWFQCNLCEVKFKLKCNLTKHMKIHLNHKQMTDRLDLREKRYGCNKCNYETHNSAHLKMHNLMHLKPEEIDYFYCYHCSYKSKEKENLKRHIFKHNFKNVKQGKRYHCDTCYYKTYTSANLKRHNLVHLKPEEIEYFYCYHCSYKSKHKAHLKEHIFKHFKKEQVKFNCYICNFMTPKRLSIIRHIKKHSKVQNKSEINEGS